MSDPIQDIARQLGITTFGDGLLTKIRETIDLLQSDANNLMQYKEVAAELEAELAALKAANTDLQIHFDTIKADHDQLKAKAAVPDGWKLIPLVPTGEMLNACLMGGKYENRLDLRPAIYRAMLAAAPAQPQSDAVTTEPIEVVGYLNASTAEIVKYGPTVMDWDDEQEPVESLMTVAQHKRIMAVQPGSAKGGE